ncbi:MAG TPA: glycosyl transferase family 2, partial [Verrucomicrobia bacterium]|nr:glycosyl transferase family 2 [Verrucomicrobiota bacterium]
SFKEAICIRQEHQGASAARNAGIACAHGDMIAFQDADDFWLPNKLTVQVNWLLAHPEIGYLAAHFTNFLEDGVPRPSWIEAHQLNEPQKGGLSTLISRRSVFDKAGLFDPAQKEGADLDWSLRARDAGFAAVAIPDVLMRRRIHGGNLSHQWQGGTALLIKSLKASLDRRRASGNGVGQYT